VVAEILCTRVPDDPANPTNPLMVPPCHCPRCSAEPEVVALRRTIPFLRVAGREQRLRVELFDLGPAGHDALG